MPFTQALFGFRGRLGRLAYFGYLFLAGVMALVLAGTGMALLSPREGTGLIGIALIAAGFLGYVWVTVAVQVKRLHDLDMAGTHLIWVLAVSAGAGAFTSANQTLAILFGLGTLMISLWLLFAPGTSGANRFGATNGATTTDSYYRSARY